MKRSEMNAIDLVNDLAMHMLSFFFFLDYVVLIKISYLKGYFF